MFRINLIYIFKKNEKPIKTENSYIHANKHTHVNECVNHPFTYINYFSFEANENGWIKNYYRFTLCRNYFSASDLILDFDVTFLILEGSLFHRRILEGTNDLI